MADMKCLSLGFFVIVLIQMCVSSPLISVEDYHGNDDDHYVPNNPTTNLIPKDLKERSVSDMKYWPSGVIPFVLHAALPTEIKTAITSAMRQIESNVNSNNKSTPCIRFVNRTDQSYYINITHGDGCFAMAGFKSVPGQTISIGKGCESKGVIMHELMHVLGFHHEQNRHDRDSYIVINHGNIVKNKGHDFMKFPELDTFGLPYDYTSITHYGAYLYSKDPTRPVIRPLKDLKENVVLGQRKGLSIYDVLKIQKAYQCEIYLSNVDFGFTDDYIVSCHFGKGMCNLKPGAGSTASWITTRGPITNGPFAGHSTGRDAFLVATDAVGNKGKIARIVTPESNGGPFCLDFFYFQTGPTSYINIIASGDTISAVKIRSYRGVKQKSWKRVLAGINVDSGIKVRITLEARIWSGTVGVDDVNMYPGKCGH